MTLQTDTIGQLFSVMQAAYGHQWPHKADAIPVWQAKLAAFDLQSIMSAAAKAIEQHPNFPPSVGQLIQILNADKPRTTTYALPAPFDQANHDKSIRSMNKLRDMPAYRPFGVANVER